MFLLNTYKQNLLTATHNVIFTAAVKINKNSMHIIGQVGDLRNIWYFP